MALPLDVIINYDGLPYLQKLDTPKQGDLVYCIAPNCDGIACIAEVQPDGRYLIEAKGSAIKNIPQSVIRRLVLLAWKSDGKMSKGALKEFDNNIIKFELPFCKN